MSVGAGAVAAYRTRNISLALIIGLPIYWLCTAAGLA